MIGLLLFIVVWCAGIVALGFASLVLCYVVTGYPKELPHAVEFLSAHLRKRQNK